MISVSRLFVQKELGRRVSRGEFERVMNKLVPIEVRTQSTRKGVPKGTPRIVMVMHPYSPKSKRKHPRWLDEDGGNRARFRRAF